MELAQKKRSVDMRKSCFVAAFMIVIISTAFCGGEAETGRGTAAEQVSEGQLLPVGAIDPGSYLSDFDSDITNEGREALLVSAALMQEQIWERGGLMALRIVLAANKESFFHPTPGLFVLFFQNPELLRNTSLMSSIAKLAADHRELDIRIFDSINETLYPASTVSGFLEAADRIKSQQKIYEQNKLIQQALGTMASEGSKRSHLLWVTDENIAERPADLTFFDFAVELLAGANTTFSYLAYGELPNWTSINDALIKRNGNSYYANGEAEIPEKIERDLGFFRRPGVEDVQVSIDWARPVTERNAFYSSEYYGTMPSFRPTVINNRPRAFHNLGGMNYSEIKRFIHYLYLPTYLDLVELPDPTPLLRGRTLTVGRVFVRYYIPMDDSWAYLQQDLTIEYVDAKYAGDITIDPMVELDTIIQNTPLIMLEAARLVNSNRNFLLALKLLQAQIALLRDLGTARPDTALDEDIKTLDRDYEIVFAQAKAVNLLE